MVYTVLMSTAGGGMRSIGLFPTVVRIWMRARVRIAQAWEADHASLRLFGGKGMGAQRVACTAAFQAESAENSGLAYAVVLLDLVK